MHQSVGFPSRAVRDAELTLRRPDPVARRVLSLFGGRKALAQLPQRRRRVVRCLLGAGQRLLAGGVGVGGRDAPISVGCSRASRLATHAAVEGRRSPPICSANSR